MVLPSANCAVSPYLVRLLVLVATISAIGSSNRHDLAVLDSLMYSSVFPFTVSAGGFPANSWYLGHLSIIAFFTVCGAIVNPSMETVCHMANLIAVYDDRWYLTTLLYLTTFEAISQAAQASFNFEEVSLISHGIIHTVIYLYNTPGDHLSPHEIFLPALTFGMLFAIAPAVPVLRKIPKSSDTTRLAFMSYTIVILSIIFLVRPWLITTLREDPVIWIFLYMTSYAGYELRLAIVFWWIIVLAFGILVPVKFFSASSNQQDDGESLNKRRKFFHGIVVLLFLPALSIDVSFLPHLSDN
jgi:hypothetical protein